MIFRCKCNRRTWLYLLVLAAVAHTLLYGAKFTEKRLRIEQIGIFLITPVAVVGGIYTQIIPITGLGNDIDINTKIKVKPIVYIGIIASIDIVRLILMDSIERNGITRLQLPAIMDCSTIPILVCMRQPLMPFINPPLDRFQFLKRAAYVYHYKYYRIGRISVDHLIVKRDELVVGKSFFLRRPGPYCALFL